MKGKRKISQQEGFTLEISQQQEREKERPMKVSTDSFEVFEVKFVLTFSQRHSTHSACVLRVFDMERKEGGERGFSLVPVKTPG